MFGYDSTESEDLITCPHCGYKEYPEVGMGHICEAGRQAGKAASDRFEASWIGDGTRFKRKITIEIDCYNTEAAIGHVMNDIGYNYTNGGFSDDVLEFSWRIV